ncbi:hypothetical protein J3R30DRAFT_3403464 [Lentinula aciculospora]|uniref:DUF6534 domain-containing protein n=1 Tax=Lentinula aciculospora TaxID=153920 RepID=A0A9W9AF09_9AGAR|nr:hypothetical protein J3R30DRAFT_3403464 [Lentinula aciculospora]
MFLARYGPMLIGVFLNMILYGMLFYFRTYTSDSIWVRLFVAYLLVLETANTAIDMAMMYQPLIAEYGTQQAVMYFPTHLLNDRNRRRPFISILDGIKKLMTRYPEPILIVLISTPIQTFFALRIRRITQAYWIPGIVMILALASCVGGFITGVKIEKLKLFSEKPELHWSALLWFITACVADLLITATLVWNLAQRKTGFVITDSVVDKIIKIQFVLSETLLSLWPYQNFLWDLTLTKLYTNCLMSTLNARAGLLNSQSTSSGPQRNALDPSISRYVEHPRNVMSAPHVYELGDTRTFESTHSGRKTPYSLHQDVEVGITVTKVIETTADPIS